MTPFHYMTAEASGTVVFPFRSLTGALVPTVPKTEREVRPGVNGIGLWLTGTRGEPFSISTTLDCVDIAAAHTAFAAYKSAIPSKKDLYILSVLWGTVVLMDVKLDTIQRFNSAVGGIQNFAGGSGVDMKVTWTLETLV
jgi:hypothetical protein